MTRFEAHRSASRITRYVLFGLIAVTSWALYATRAHAAMATDVRAGVYTQANAVGVGAGLLTPVTSDDRWYFNPNLEVGFGDRRNLVSMNGDFHYDLPRQSTTSSVWVGGGPALLIDDPEFGDTHTDVGLNLLTGIGGTRGTVRPFGQLKGVVANEGSIVLQGGIRF